MTDKHCCTSPGHTHDHTHDHHHAHTAHDTSEHNHEHVHHVHHHHPHGHSHTHEHTHDSGGVVAGYEALPQGCLVLTIRAAAGLSGDMILAGLARMGGVSDADIATLIKNIGVAKIDGSVNIIPHSVSHIAGWLAKVDLPHEHSHRSFADICKIIEASVMPDTAKALAQKTFALIAEAEGAVHQKKVEEVTFHEVGALDSILDICLACQLFEKLAPALLSVSPLPVADGVIHCAHGFLPSPAPAVLRLLEGVPVCAFSGKGETVTPTAIALLKAFGAHFGPWPPIQIEKTAITYGTKVFANAPNGAIWALGSLYRPSFHPVTLR